MSDARFAPRSSILAGLGSERTGSGFDDRRPLLPDSPTPPDQADSSGQSPTPRFEYGLTFFARLTADLRAEVLGETPDGYRINFFVLGGSIVGPDIHAEIRAEGGDWMCIREDGLGIVDINITYDTDDGALILEQAGGVFQLGTDGLANVKSGRYVGEPPFFATPRWLTSSPAWAHLNGIQGFGFGRVVMEQLQVQCDIYHPSVGARLDP